MVCNIVTAVNKNQNFHYMNSFSRYKWYMN